MEMVKVSQCDAIECSYNLEQQCHALAITIGNMVDPKCDTFCTCPMKGGDISRTGSVGACKVEACTYNQSLECSAPSISVGHKAQDIDCLTFTTQ